MLSLTLIPAACRADGGFVTVSPPPWDKHRDINEPTQKAIIVYDRGQEDLILQVKYEGPVDQFGWLIPVPNLPTVTKGSMKCFYELSQYTQQRFFEPGAVMMAATASLGDHSSPPPPPPVKVVETKTVGAYDIAVLSTKDSGALKKWLDDNHYDISPDKSDVIDSYVKRQWHFVAVKINLGSSFRLLSTSKKLASGELNPLQISFASDRCVFPLKISSINGKPSEVSLYVLSPEPLLELGMLEKKLPLIYSNDMVMAANRLRYQQAFTHRGLTTLVERFGGIPPDVEKEEIVQKWNSRPFPPQEELLPYAKVTKKDLPECGRLIPALAGQSWWLTKRTWTFQPEEMRDLNFDPALPAFTEMLGSKYGYFAASSLASFGKDDGVPSLLQAMQNPDPAVRTNAATAFNNMFNWGNIYQIADDPRIEKAALSWLTDSEPSVRIAGLDMLNNYVTHTKFNSLPMLQDPDPTVRCMALADVFSPENQPISDEVVTTLLHNSEAYIREDGVTALFNHANKHAVELALPMLKDPNMFVRQLAGSTLRALTGQDFSDDQIDNWNAWWNQSKDNFTVHLRRELFGFHPANFLASLRSTNMDVAVEAYAQLTRQQRTLTDDQALALLKNPMPVARMYGLEALSQKVEYQSVIMAIPFLKDPDEKVRLKASQVLWVLTGQPWTVERSDQWIKWWNENTNSVGQPHSKDWIWPDGQAYLEQGCEFYDQNNFVEALADFRQACELSPNGTDVQDYSHDRIWLTRVRLGENEAATQELVSYLENRKTEIPPWLDRRFGENEAATPQLAAYKKAREAAYLKIQKEENPLDWPLPLGRFLAGQITEADLLKAAAVNAPEIEGVRYCQAYFYAGSKRLIENDRTGAAKLFKKCLGTGMNELYEYHSAQAELTMLH